MHPSDCRCVVCLVDRSSLGTPEVKAARNSVSDEQVARLMRRVRELEAERNLTTPTQAHATPEPDGDAVAGESGAGA